MCRVNSILKIKKTIAEKKGEVSDLMHNTKCNKWLKWFNTKETPYPCVCDVRDKDCIELELHYELQKAKGLYNQNSYFKNAIEEFEFIDNNNKAAVIAWVKKQEPVGSKLFFNLTISILSNPKENEKLTFQLDPSEFKYIIKFQELFGSIYYSEEYQQHNL